MYLNGSYMVCSHVQLFWESIMHLAYILVGGVLRNMEANLEEAATTSRLIGLGLLER